MTMNMQGHRHHQYRYTSSQGVIVYIQHHHRRRHHQYRHIDNRGYPPPRVVAVAAVGVEAVEESCLNIFPETVCCADELPTTRESVLRARSVDRLRCLGVPLVRLPPPAPVTSSSAFSSSSSFTSFFSYPSQPSTATTTRGGGGVGGGYP